MIQSAYMQASVDQAKMANMLVLRTAILNSELTKSYVDFMCRHWIPHPEKTWV